VDSASPFAEALWQYRRARGLTQAELAEQAHLSERAISDLERGLKMPQRGTVRMLAEALGLLPDQARDFDAVARMRITESAQAGGASTTNLPIERGPLFGRDRDTAAVCEALLRQEGCLITLVGPGGVGKTRLALWVANQLRGAHADGVWFVDLSAVTEADRIAATVANALGIRVELDSGPEVTLVGYLTERRPLLVVDNCEHLVEPCADLFWTLRQRCSSVRILATSREPLGIDGEVVWRLRPLEAEDAAQLFVKRVQPQHATLVVEDAAAVLQLCRRLDGLPLAIELAAARIGMLTPSEMLAYLEDRFALLRRSSRGGAIRHQTLRATVDWSYELLQEVEQQLFRGLAVFAGGFDLAAARAMGGPNTLDVLGRLIDKSLVLAEPGAHGTRYRLLETLRQYAWERLQEADAVEFARARHVEHFLARAETLYSPMQIGGPLRTLDWELDNLRVAFDWCEQTNPVAGLRLLAATGYVWWRQSAAEGRAWANLFLARCPEPTLARAGALHAAGMLELFSDPARARHLEQEAYDLAQRLDDQATAAIARAMAGYASVLQENPLEAVPELEHGLALTEKVGDPRGIAWVLVTLAAALLTNHARREEGREKVERALVMAAEVGEPGDQVVLSFGHFILGLYWRWSGVPPRALEHFRLALELLSSIELVPNLSSVLLQVARLLAPSDSIHAANLAAAALAFAERAGIRFPRRYRRAADTLRVELRGRLGPALMERAWREGGQLSTTGAITLALEVTGRRRRANPARRNYTVRSSLGQ